MSAVLVKEERSRSAPTSLWSAGKCDESSVSCCPCKLALRKLLSIRYGRKANRRNDIKPPDRSHCLKKRQSTINRVGAKSWAKVWTEACDSSCDCFVPTMERAVRNPHGNRFTSERLRSACCLLSDSLQPSSPSCCRFLHETGGELGGLGGG